MTPGQPKPKRTRRFTLLSVLSITIAALLILPLVFFGQPPSQVRFSPPLHTFTIFTVRAHFTDYSTTRRILPRLARDVHPLASALPWRSSMQRPSP